MFILPTRSRPHNLERLAMHWRYTDATAPVCVYLDTDDPALSEYRALDLPPDWTIHIGERAPYNPVWHINNRHYAQFPNQPWYGHINDDMVPRRYHWDRELIETAGANLIAYGDDLLQGRRMCTFPVIGGDLVRRVGRLMFDGINIDTAWMLLGFKYGLLRYRPDIILEHLHWTNGKAPKDDTYGYVDEAIKHGGTVDALEAFVRFVLDPKTAGLIGQDTVDPRVTEAEGD